MGSSCKHRMGETRHSARHDFPQPKSGLLPAGGLWRAIWLVGGIGCFPAVPRLSPGYLPAVSRLSPDCFPAASRMAPLSLLEFPWLQRGAEGGWRSSPRVCHSLTGPFPAVSRKHARTPTAYVPAKSYVLVKSYVPATLPLPRSASWIQAMCAELPQTPANARKRLQTPANIHKHPQSPQTPQTPN